MKTGKFLLLMIMLCGILASSGCKKYVEQGKNNNIIENYTVTVSPSMWTQDGTNERFYYRYSVTTNAGSVVVAYLSGSSGEQALPYYSTTSSVGEYYGLATNLSGTSQYIEFQYRNIFTPNSPPSSDKTFYIHILPPGEYAAHPDLDWRDYPAVQREFGLAE
jgi:hypothetical protein